MMVKIITVRDGIENAQHPVFRPVTFHPVGEWAIPPDEIEYRVCHHRINPRTGKSLTCEHKVAFVSECTRRVNATQ